MTNETQNLEQTVQTEAELQRKYERLIEEEFAGENIDLNANPEVLQRRYDEAFEDTNCGINFVYGVEAARGVEGIAKRYGINLKVNPEALQRRYDTLIWCDRCTRTKKIEDYAKEKGVELDTLSVLTKAYEQIIQESRGLEVGRANSIYDYAKEKGVELKLSPESLKILTEQYKQQLKGEVLDYTESIGWTGCPQWIEWFAKGKAELELVLQEAFKEIYNKEDSWFKERLKKYAQEQKLNWI